MAVVGFVRGVALELARGRITMNAVEPGFTLSHTVQTYLLPERIAAVTATVAKGPAALPADITAALVFLASDEAGYATGQTFAVGDDHKSSCQHFKYRKTISDPGSDFCKDFYEYGPTNSNLGYYWWNASSET